QPAWRIVVVFFDLLRRNISAGGVKPIPVIPGDPPHGSDGDIANAPPRPFPIDELSLVQRINRLRRSVVVRIALAADRTNCTDLTQPLAIANRRISHAPVGMMDELALDVIAG